MSEIESKYLPVWEGVFFNRASSPSAASRIDLITKKRNAHQNHPFNIKTTAARPQTTKARVTCIGVKRVVLNPLAIVVAIGLP